MNNAEQRPEAPIKDYLATFKFYDRKGRRLSIFGKLLDENTLQLTVLTLSDTPEQTERVNKTFASRGNGDKRKLKKVIVELQNKYDQFSKKVARQKYEEMQAPGFAGKQQGHVFTVAVVDGRPRFTFLSYANEHYYRQVSTRITVNRLLYVRGKNYKHPLKKNENTNQEAAS